MTRSPRYRLPKFVQAFVDRDGRAYHYFRRRASARVPLPGLPWSPEFMAAYQRALESSSPKLETTAGKRGSVAEAVATYVDGFACQSGLSPNTQAKRRRILQNYVRNFGHGDRPIASVTTDELTRVLAALTPGTREDLLKAIRGLMKSSVARGLIKTDPTVGIKMSRRKTDGYHTWSEDEIAQFEAHHRIGTKPRLALALLLYTAQRRGDVIRMGRQHLRDCDDKDLRALGIRSILSLRQQKTGTPVAVPVLPELQAILDETPSEHLTFIVSALGKPFHPGAFSNWFGAACAAAGLPKGCSAHGLRKAALTRFAEAGCTTHGLAAISGHLTLEEVQRYTQAADRARLAKRAMATVIKARPKVSRSEPTLTPARLTGRRNSKKS